MFQSRRKKDTLSK